MSIFFSLCVTDCIKKANDLKRCKIFLRKHKIDVILRLCSFCVHLYNDLLHLSLVDKSKF